METEKPKILTNEMLFERLKDIQDKLHVVVEEYEAGVIFPEDQVKKFLECSKDLETELNYLRGK